MTPIVERQNQCKLILYPFSLWIIQVFALLFGACKPNRIIRKVENVDVYWAGGKERWPLSWPTKTSLWRRREPTKQSYSTPADQHHGRSSTCKNSDPVKPTLFAHQMEPWETPRKTLILASWALGLKGRRSRRDWVARLIYYNIIFFLTFFFTHLNYFINMKTGLEFSSLQFCLQLHLINK